MIRDEEERVLMLEEDVFVSDVGVLDQGPKAAISLKKPYIMILIAVFHDPYQYILAGGMGIVVVDV